MEPNRESKIHLFSRFRWCGRVFRRVALFYRVRRKRVFIAMGNENVDFRTLHFQYDFNGTTLVSLGLAKERPGTFFERPRLAWSSPEQPWDAIFTTWSASGCRFPEILHKIVGHSADDVPMTFRWHSDDIPMTFRWLSDDFSMTSRWLSDDFPMTYPCLPVDIPLTFL